MNTSQQQEMQESENLDLLLREKYRRERLEKLKKQIPMPEVLETPKVRRIGNRRIMMMAASLVLVVGCVFVFQWFGKTNPTTSAQEMLYSSVINMDADNQVRGGAEVVQNEKLEFFDAIQLLKKEEIDHQGVLNILKPLTEVKNKHQIESLWLSGLVEISRGNTINGRLYLEELRNQSDYQKNNVAKLLEQLK